MALVLEQSYIDEMIAHAKRPVFYAGGGIMLVIATVGLAGAWSDRLGRRPIAVMGYALMGVGIALTPFVGGLLTFYSARAIIAVGLAMITVMITAIVSDYVRDETRGKANGILGL